MSDDMLVIPVSQGKPDLSPFRDATERKLSWDQRVSLIKEQFPAVERLDWGRAFRQDPTMLGRLINDIFKLDAAEPGKPGKRPAIDPKFAEQRLREITGDDYTTRPFAEVFGILTQGRSIRNVAAKTGLDRNYVHRLLRGEATPTAQVMEQVANAFKRKPEFFAEYRLQWIIAILYFKLEKEPESTVLYSRRMQKVFNA